MYDFGSGVMGSSGVFTNGAMMAMKLIRINLGVNRVLIGNELGSF